MVKREEITIPSAKYSGNSAKREEGKSPCKYGLQNYLDYLAAGEQLKWKKQHKKLLIEKRLSVETPVLWS